MSDPTLQQQIDAARAYESLHVPALFREWAPRVLDAAEVEAGERVLDVACGTGVLAREALKRTAPGGFVAGVDPAPGMLAVADELAPEIEWRPGVAEDIPYPPETFDAVVSQFGLMFFTDRTRAIRDMVRVLKPGGSLAVAVWDTLENSDAYREEVALLDRVGGKAAGDALRAPFVLGHIPDLAQLFRDAGVDGIAVTTFTGTARFPDIRTMVESDLRGWLPVMGVNLSETQMQQILAEAESALKDYLTPKGTVAFEAPAHIVIASRE
jgi:SAM-dependent methyltransferase